MKVHFQFALQMAVIAAIVLVAAADARAEYAVLKNGQRLHITGYERAGDTVQLHVSGGRITLRLEELAAIEPEEIFAPLPAPQTAPGPFGEHIRAAAQESGLDEHLIASVISAESNFNARAISRKGAQGLMQLMPATAARFSVSDVFDPAQNIRAGSLYLKKLLDRYNGNLTLALAAYNAGPERVEQYSGVPPFAETKSYVKKVSRGFEKRKKS